MRKSIVVLMFVLSACGTSTPDNNNKEQDVVIEEGAVKTASADTMYYIYTAGTKQQDTDAVKIIINGNIVEGKMMYMPAEKDWRFGKLYGSREGEFMNLTWIFIQEGIKDSAQVVFRLKGDQLIQQSYSSDADTGENIVDTTSFMKIYKKTDRNNFPRQEFDMGLL